jgi:hypothetical protein
MAGINRRRKSMAKTRLQIIDDGRRIITEIRQIFLDAEHWNRLHPDEEPLDPDPQGELRALLLRLTGRDAMAREA